LINSQMGLLTAMAILVALVFDFTLLPVLLLIGHKRKGETYEPICLPQETC
jgi:predicted RND superfamily exporter protein